METELSPLEYPVHLTKYLKHKEKKSIELQISQITVRI